MEIEVEEIKYDEAKGKLSFAVNIPIVNTSYHWELERQAKIAVEKTLESLPEDIEVFRDSVEQFVMAQMTMRHRLILVFNYRRLTPFGLKEKLEEERINYFVNNLELNTR